MSFYVLKRDTSSVIKDERQTKVSTIVLPEGKRTFALFIIGNIIFLYDSFRL